MIIEIQCTSCHTRYRIDEQVLPEGAPTFKCSRCGHVFTLEPRAERAAAAQASSSREPEPPRTGRSASSERAATPPEPAVARQPPPDAEPRWVTGIEQPSAPAAQSKVDPAAPRSAGSERLEGSAPPAARQAEPGNPPPAGQRPSTDDLMSRPIRATPSEEKPSPGNNPTFEFHDEQRKFDDTATVAADDDLDDANHWSVGDDAAFDAPAKPGHPAAAPMEAQFATAEPSAEPRRRAPRRTRKARESETEFIDEADAPVYNHNVTHSARFMLGLMLLVALGYCAVTAVVRSAPAAAAQALSLMPLIGDRFVMPITPARLVALRAVHADYLRTKGGHHALVITGIAENVGVNPLHTVRIAVDLRDSAQRPLADRSIYCGNTLSAAMVAQMTPHEIDFFQKLDPPKTFALQPAATAPFVVVFVDPPDKAARFAVMVASAIAAAPAAGDAG